MSKTEAARPTPLGVRARDVRTRGRALLGAALAAGRSVAAVAAVAGRPMVRTPVWPSPWVQLNLAPATRDRSEAYAQLREISHEFLDDGRVRNVFFMHKEPGLRARFEAADPDPSPLRAALLRRLKGSEALRHAPVCAVYEPEHYLFGGRASMPYVHGLFTADSLAWLDHHLAAPGREGELAAWRHSLLLLRECFTGLGIVGWEHRGVWEAVRERTGRGVRGAGPADPAALAARQRAAEGIVSCWRAPREQLLAAFPEERRTTLAAHADAAREAGERWRRGYFEAGSATVGPRAAAAYATVFHWNRGALSTARQGLLTDALAEEGDHDAAHA
ncbi:thiopeptide-type bacteriocin biosynthesis protein [Streptomyces sp. NPDC048172]|uniref:thiopeptide-type bacteriocin biosynthesis protein n=1 Tax=Streptomyces sp. NPDC048172 TaxID=3365505 RepID=UPI003721708F